MLRAEEVDDDYFTPTSSTTLANIFGNSSKPLHSGNESLKYSPPKPQSATVVKADIASKATECIFACSLYAYEWLANTYSAKGKVGFALIKDIKNNIHEIILYDSNKTPLSRTTISKLLDITVKENVYMSYYDNAKKYWNIHATEEEVSKISSLVKALDVRINYNVENESGPPEPLKIEPKQITLPKTQNDKESDTDSSLNRKTKNSILNRMASMGQSVLPRKAASTERTSDSSDNDLSDDNSKVPRHKPVKCIVKRINTDKVTPELTTKVISSQTGTFLNTSPIYAHGTGQIMLLDNNTNSAMHAGSGSEFNLFLAEQRINNSEMRINLNRINDKVDQVLDKMKDFNHKDVSVGNDNDFHMNILRKLMAEYERKIKIYEELLASKNIEVTYHQLLPKSMELEINKVDEITVYKNNILELEKIVEDKDKFICSLNQEILLLKKKVKEQTEEHANKISQLKEETDHLKQEIVDLKDNLCSKQQEIEVSKASKIEEVTLENNASESSNLNIENRIKKVMNDTFRAISVNFDSGENYSGDTVKGIIATVIKKVTLQSLKEK